MDLIINWAEVKNILDSLGWLGNLLALFSALSFGYIVIKFIIQLCRKSERSLEDAINKLIGTESSANRRILKKLNLVIVDDKPEDYPIDYLRNIFQSVSIIESISLAAWDSLLEYDWIFLDVKGVVVEDPESGGLEILRRLKESESSPIVVAVSSKRFDPTVSEYFQKADLTMKKPIQAVDCEEKLNNLLLRSHGPYALARKLDSIIDESEVSDAEIFKALAMRYVSTGNYSEKLRKSASKLLGYGSVSKVTGDIQKIRNYVCLLK